MAKETLKSFDDLPKILSKNKKELSRETTQYPGYRIHEKYPEGFYNLDSVFSETSPEFDRWYIPGKKGDLVVASGTKEEDLYTSKSFGSLLEKNKIQILETLGVSSKSNYSKIKELLNQVNGLLKQAFEDRTKNDYTEGYKHLSTTNTQSFTNGFYKVLVSSVNEKGIVVSLSKEGKKTVKLFVPEKNLLQKDVYLRGDEIVVYAEKKRESLSLLEVDKKFLQIQRRNLFDKSLFYMPKHAKKPFKGKIVGIGEDINKGEIVFVPESGVQFALGIDIFLEGIKKAASYRQEQQKFQEKKLLTHKKPLERKSDNSSRRVVWDGRNKYSSKIKGRDGKKIQHAVEI